MQQKHISISFLDNIIRSKEMELQGLRELREWFKDKEFEKTTSKMASTALWKILLQYK
jgi:hypothetical protein